MAIKTDNNSLSSLLGLLPFLLPLLLWMKMERAGKKGGEGDSTMIERKIKDTAFSLSKLKLLIFIDCVNEGTAFSSMLEI